MIASGDKKEEYRKMSNHWAVRLSGYAMFHGLPRVKVNLKQFATITFQHGYSKTARRMVVVCKGIDIGPAKAEWSGGVDGDVFRIHLGNIISKNF